MRSMPLPTTKRDLLGLEWLSWVQVNGKIMRERERDVYIYMICIYIYIPLRLLLVYYIFLYSILFYSILCQHMQIHKNTIYIIQPPISWVCLSLCSTPRTPELTHGQLSIGKFGLETTGPEKKVGERWPCTGQGGGFHVIHIVFRPQCQNRKRCRPQHCQIPYMFAA